MRPLLKRDTQLVPSHMKHIALVALAVFALAAVPARCQDPTGTLEGEVADADARSVSLVRIRARHLDTGFVRDSRSNDFGYFRITGLPAGNYEIIASAPRFAQYAQRPVSVGVSQTVRLDIVLSVAGVSEAVTVTDEAPLVDKSTNTLGKTITGREILDLPLNGRNFTQLGLLQAGAAPLTLSVTSAGGTLRQGQAYAVNGSRPESNLYLLDGAQNVNRMDGGFALKVPVDAIAEFRILTQLAPPEYGGTAGPTTTVVTRTGTNRLRGSIYEFLRNERLDARNFFSTGAEPLKQNQFGSAIGGPIRKNMVFFFGYYEGFRNRQGFTTTATVPTEAQKAGDFSGIGHPLLNFAAGGTPFLGNRIPEAALNPVARNVLAMYPAGNVSPTIYRETVVATNYVDQAGGRLDLNRSESDQFFVRYSFSGGQDVNPVSVRGSDVPGFPTRNNIRGQNAAMSENHMFTPSVQNSAGLNLLRYVFEFDRRLNQTPPRALGFNFDSASALGQGPPFFNISGYSPIGGAIVGPRDSAQTTYELHDSVSVTRGAHSIKTGGMFLRTRLNVFVALVPNGFYVFASTFPTNDAVANLLLGAAVTFNQGLGDFSRGLRIWNAAAFVQDEWRISDRLTFNYGIRWERINPITEIRDRINAFVPGIQSTVRPDAPRGLLFPGDAGIGTGIAQSYDAWMPRLGFAWDPSGRGIWALRAAYGLSYDQFQNGASTALQAPVSSLPWAQFNQFSGPGLNFASPYTGQLRPLPGTFARPSSVFAIDPTAKPPSVHNWNFNVQRGFGKQYLIEARYVGTKGTHLPRNIEANPAVYGPGASAQNADRRRVYANCPPAGAACDFFSIAMLSNITNSTYHAGQVSLSRRYSAGLYLNMSYWYSKALDYLSAMNLSGGAARSLAGENDLAQNPFNLAAEHGPSLFDARHRFVASGSYEVRLRSAAPVLRALFDRWQANAIAAHNSPTPFTVFDSANAALQANSPSISGFVASRPDVIGDPNAGPHTVNQWLNASAFRRLDPVSEAGRFGSAGRNIARGPAVTNLDVSILRTFPITERINLQFRAEAFNAANHANFGLPDADLNSSNFDRIFSAGPPRLLQFGLKLIF